MIRIYLYLYRLGELQLILLFVGGDGALQFTLDVWAQQLCLFLMQTDDRIVRFVRQEVLVAIHQGEGIHRHGISVAFVVCLLQLLPRVFFETEPHQVDAELGARPLQARIEFESLAVVGDSFLVSAIEYQNVAGEIPGIAVNGIDAVDAAFPLATFRSWSRSIVR